MAQNMNVEDCNSCVMVYASK